MNRVPPQVPSLDEEELVARAVCQRCEAELGEEQGSFIEGCPRDWGNLPIPDGPITVGIDGGYVRDWDEKKRNFEVIVGKSTPLNLSLFVGV